MREADHGPLAFPPLQDGKIPGGPVLDPLRVRIVLILQPQQHEMAGMAGGKSRHLEVVVHQAVRSRQRIVLAGEELLLVVVAGTPGEDRTEVQRLALNLTDHVVRQNAFGRILIMRAAGRVNVMVSRVPAERRRIDPSFQRE